MRAFFCHLLNDIGETLNEARHLTYELTEANTGRKTRSIQITPAIAQVMEVAGLEAERLDSKSIRTEHMLLAVLGEEGGVCSRILEKLTRPEMIRYILDAARSSQAA